ncbi:hypothetical protein BGZ61DRAFT_10207 [Ilyonectria robusta]|uniref:uncharacterized protein n=1 Tax=Ilyonectria robusta TaxID=1079257 RepID=UPI001E8D4221|nr:uncharacterized protein BGZ61DRAFT_10207 [Ilyonectria robusta]KAH8737155.1 hypothetical protein BGZ61DRAFT_10207 [Ilyonectria robusta]
MPNLGNIAWLHGSLSTPTPSGIHAICGSHAKKPKKPKLAKLAFSLQPSRHNRDDFKLQVFAHQPNSPHPIPSHPRISSRSYLLPPSLTPLNLKHPALHSLPESLPHFTPFTLVHYAARPLLRHLESHPSPTAYLGNLTICAGYPTVRSAKDLKAFAKNRFKVTFVSQANWSRSHIHS